MSFQNFIKIPFIIAIVFFSSCKDDSSRIRLVYPNKVNYESLIIANHLGYLREAASNIDVVTVASGINAAEALSLGSADIAAMGDGPAIILMSQKKKASVVTRYAKGEKIHRLISDAHLHSPEELIGKRIGLQIGSSTHAAFLAWLSKQGINKDDITVVPMDPRNMPEAMKNKQLDAIAGSEPWALNVEKLSGGAVHEFVNLQNERNHFPHLLLANNQFITNQKFEIKSIIRAIEKANRFIAAYPDSSAKIAAHYIGLSESEQKECMSRLSWEVGWSDSDYNSLNETTKFFRSSKRISNIPEINNYLKLILPPKSTHNNQ